MTAPTDQFVDIAKRSQEAFATAARTWVDSVQALAGNVASSETKLPDVQGYFDSYFDIVEKLLSSQRDLSHQWIRAALKAGEAVSEQTKSVLEHATNGSVRA